MKTLRRFAAATAFIWLLLFNVLPAAQAAGESGGSVPLPAAGLLQGGEATALSPSQLKAIDRSLLEKGGLSGVGKPGAERETVKEDSLSDGKPAGERSLVQAPRQVSTFEAYVASREGTDAVRQFGYDLFSAAAAFAPDTEVLPVGPDYLLGPGDELSISLWGKVNVDYAPVIDREGKISLPYIGVLHLAGLTFGEAKQLLLQTFSRYFKPSEVKVSVGMGSLRSISVFVVGQVRRPGSYRLSSFSTLVNALFAAGGPGKTGSMRAVELRRGGKTVAVLDLYDFILRGDKDDDLRLMSGDVVFVPTVGPLAAVTGNVLRPAIYELKGKVKLTDLIEMAGGVGPMGYLGRVQVERVHANESKVIVDVNLKDLAPANDIVIRDGDIVRIFSIFQEVTNYVRIEGNVSRPGMYEWKEGMRLGELLKGGSLLLPDTYYDFALIERRVPPDFHSVYVSVDLGKLLHEHSEKDNVELRPYDTVTIYSKWNFIDKEMVRVAGAVGRPGEFEFRPDMRLSDLLNLAGGLKKYAYAEEAELTRVSPTPSGPEVEKIVVYPAKALARLPGYDIHLQPDDYLFVRAVPEWGLYRTVTIEGEVRFPGRYTIEKGETLSSLIERAGGFTDKAYLMGAVFTRESVRELQQRRLDEAIDRLEQEIVSRSAHTIEAALTPDEAAQQEAAAKQRKALIAKLRAVKAQGRVVIELKSLDKFKGSRFDIPMEEGDRLFIPERPVHVQVIGSVYNQNAYVYQPGATVASYLDMSGGLTDLADEDAIYVLKVNGEAVSQRTSSGGLLAIRWDRYNKRWVSGGLMASPLDPGDTIVVPEKLERVAWLKEFKDITQILYQVAVTAGVLLVAF